MKIKVFWRRRWGTALAQLLCAGKNDVTLWGHDPRLVEDCRRSRRNRNYLPGIELSADLKFEADLPRVVAGPELVVMAVPSRAFREISGSLAHFPSIVVSTTKGIEAVSGLTMCGVLAQTAPRRQAVRFIGADAGTGGCPRDSLGDYGGE